MSGAAPRWRQELAEAIVDPAELARLAPRRTPAEVAAAAAVLPARVPRAYANLIDPTDPGDPIASMVVPDPRELHGSPDLCHDPTDEEMQSPLPGVVHRYPDRVLLLVTGRCASYCRFCMRRRFVGRAAGDRDGRWMASVVEYLDEQPGVREVILSGGDPLMLSDERLSGLLDALADAEHLEILRVDTRAPVVLPSRITPELVDLLGRHTPLWVVTQFNHPRELTHAAVAACGRLVDGGIPVENQAVLLAGVNDRAVTLHALCQGLLNARVRPYYLHQCDPVAGTAHFRTPLEKGQRLVRHLCGRIAGLGIPRFAVDTPGGHGKVLVEPGTRMRRDGAAVLLHAPDGAVVRYLDPLS